MGILKLIDFLKVKFPFCIKQIHPRSLQGKKVAIDASNVIYQFLIQTQIIKKSQDLSMPTDIYGNKTGHLLGIMARVAFCKQNSIKAVWVFDGKPPAQKYKELSRRSQLKKQAGQKMEEALIEGDLFEALKQQKRTMKISAIQKQFAVKMLNLMGLPTIEAPSESEAQCAYLSKIGMVDYVVTEDMDCLPLGSSTMLKSFSKNKTIQEINLKHILDKTKMSMDQFIDLCILCGCDYTGKIINIGPMKAYDYIRKYGTIEKIIQNLKITDTGKYRIESEFDYHSARKLFKQPVIKQVTQPLVWNQPDQEGFKEFLNSLDFNQVRIRNWLEKANKSSLH